MNIGIIGCGDISDIYLRNCIQLFPNMEVVAVADLDRERARRQADTFGIPAVLDTETLLARHDIELVLNLTPPQSHTAVNRMALDAGKHVYCEKPTALDLAEAERTLRIAGEKGLRLGSAPDTFLGAGVQLCRTLIDAGEIGDVVAANAVMACHGHESWHPNPEFYYKRGGGPMLDMGPYYLTALVATIGPVQAVTAMTKATFPTRLITSEPLNGTVIEVETTTHLTGTLLFENGAVGTITTSFDMWRSDQPHIEIHGSTGSISCPDPNTFGGPVKLFRRGGDDWVDVPLPPHGYAENARGLGAADMATAIAAGGTHRASGELAAHVLEVMLAFDRSSEARRQIEIRTTCRRPAAVPIDRLTATAGEGSDAI